MTACEDAKEEASNTVNCVTILQEIESASDAFEANPTRANCDKVVEKAEIYYNCLPDGPEKTQFKEDLDLTKTACSIL